MGLKSLRIVGPFRGTTGHDHHVREFTRELARQGVEIELIDLPSWSPTRLPEASRDPWFDTLCRPVGAGIVLHFATPHLATPVAGVKNVNFTMFEATRIPEMWVRAASKHDCVILPTEANRAAWIRSGVRESRIRLCPLGVDASVFSGSADSLDSPRVRFLNVSDINPRKNLPGLLRAWMRATTPEDDAVLIVKAHCSNSFASDLLRWKVTETEQKLGKKLHEAAPVQFELSVLGDAEMPRLYASATHYISMSFGEGWDQPMMEAAASNLRLIAPRHSAYPTYLDDSIATLISARECPVQYWGDPATAALFQNACWWEPDEEEAVATIRKAIDGTEAPKLSPRDRIARDFTWAKATERLIEILEEVSAQSKRRWSWPWLRSSSATR